MSIGIESLFTGALGLKAPWVVENVKLDTAERRIDFEISCQGVRLVCLDCGSANQPVACRVPRPH